MKIRNFLLFVFFISLSGCKDDRNEADIQKSELTSFIFKKENNAKLSWDITCDIKDNTITARISHLTSADGLVPSFSGSFSQVEVDGEIQHSGISSQNFNNIINYKVISKNGTEHFYQVIIKTYSGIPIVKIETENKLEIVSKEDYVNGYISISKTPDFDSGFEGPMHIRGRGNATWESYPKKPYRIKLDEKSEILGMPADKDWVLLAEYCDKSMIRNACSFELSQLVGLPWTPRYRHVEVFLNGEYNGVYMLCEHVKVAKNRANIEDDGYLIENDNYWDREPMWFTTERTGVHYTFKYPDTDDFSEGDETYNFIKNYMDAFENALFGSNFKNADQGYRKYADARYFAKWYLLQEALGNIDTNPYYVLESRSGKLKMYPVWDFEWSLGLAAAGTEGWAKPPVVSPVDKFYRKDRYFSRMFEDPYFTNIIKEEWRVMKEERLPVLKENVKNKAESLKYAQKNNFNRWEILGEYTSVGLTKFETWQEEVDYAVDFLNKRIVWLDSEIQKL
ncbi:MAG: CotH kinase family protein [Tannerella sp.]|jgi:hypothetical protein|nr:CotH kinase family protein [Tannerella sp.]